MANANVIESTATPVASMNLVGVMRIPAIRQVLLLIGVAASVAAGFAVFVWSQSPGFTQLFSDLDTADSGQIAETLRAADIPVRIDTNNGTVLVPESRIHDARLELAGQGLPAGLSAGMDQIQEQNSFGVSQFMEGARYQYALEAELARTISNIGAVRDARVHLALPKRSAFIREQKSATASVLLTLYRGRSLEPGQASSIVHLVASSVPDLATQNVTLIDQQGRLLSSQADEWNDVQTLNQFKHTQRLEDNYKRRIEDMLTPLVGPGRIRAEVVASLDFTVTEETREAFDPQNTVVRSEQINEERRDENEANPAGVPGALSNQPPETAAVADNAAQAPEENPVVNTSLSATRNFEVDRTISRTRPQSGTIQRLSVAVLIDDSPMDGAEEGEESSLTPEDIERYTSLVKEAVGFDEARGDTVAVVNAAFRSLPAVEPPEEPAFWEKPVMRDAMKQGAGILLVLVLGFGVVRPMLKSLVAANMSSSGHYIAAGGASHGGTAQLSPGGANPMPLPSYDEKVAAAKNITGHDPARVAAVVRKWVTTDD